MSRYAVFIDGTYMWHCMQKFMTDNGLKFNLGILPHTLVNHLDPNSTLVSSTLCASMPVNTPDTDAVTKRGCFFAMLEKHYKFTVELYEINFRGRRILKKDRSPDDTWSPKEKCVDIAVASNLLYQASTYDVTVLVSGDRDYIPALNKVQALGKRVVIASFRSSCSAELSKYEIVYLDDLVTQLTL